MKVISIPGVGKDTARAIVENEKSYDDIVVTRAGGMELIRTFPKDEYGDYDKFWNIMGKWDPDFEFLKKPIEIKEISFNSFKEALRKFKNKE
jgi:hypothetical protein